MSRASSKRLHKIVEPGLATGWAPKIDGVLQRDKTLLDAGTAVALSNAMSVRLRVLLLFLAGAVAACGGADVGDGKLVINELMSNNEGAAADEVGQTDDWVELLNAGTSPVRLSEYGLADGTKDAARLPELTLAAGERYLFWVDDDVKQGEAHLPFKLSSSGDQLRLERSSGELVDSVKFGELADNVAYARFPDASGKFVSCRYASPGKENGKRCAPASAEATPAATVFSDFEWPEPWPAVKGPLVLSELALHPAQFIEVLNVSDTTVTLSDYGLSLSPHGPGAPWPKLSAGTRLSWGTTQTLAPGERVSVPVATDALANIAASPEFEGVVTLFSAKSEEVLERLDFMNWPEHAALARIPDARGPHRFCKTSTPGEANSECDGLRQRELSARDRHLRTPADFSTLAAGGTSVGIEEVKFIIDLAAGGVVHLLSSAAYALHYTFVREAIEREPPLDRCDPIQANEFQNGWIAFSQREYFRTEGRRYLLGTLTHHTGPDLYTVAFAQGDMIKAEQMKYAFFSVLQHVPDPEKWVLHAATPDQSARLLTIDGDAPIVSENAPYTGITLQPLTEGVAFGELRFVGANELDNTTLGPDVILLTDDVPNDIAFVGGLITEAFQTPLAHVNVLSRSRNTPNMALRDARNDPRLSKYLNQLVRFEVHPGGFTIAPTTLELAQAFWAEQRQSGPRIAPRQDLTVRGIQALKSHNIASIPMIGAKAAQLAELMRMFNGQSTGVQSPVPQQALAIPLAYYADHFSASGAQKIYETSAADLADPSQRPTALARIRDAITSQPVDVTLLAEVEARVEAAFGTERIRLRSSSNTEDLSDFNGAGLYTSVAAALGDVERPIAQGILTVWASLWRDRAYDEREYSNVDHARAAMGVLIHEAFEDERANGVAITRDVLDPIRADQYYVNVQFGEAAVTNPAPGVSSEEFVVRWTWPGHPVTYSGRSSLIPGYVMSQPEIDLLIKYLGQVHDHFRPLLDPQQENRWFAMDVEFKLMGPERRLIFKQARPYSFGHTAVPTDCREF